MDVKKNFTNSVDREDTNFSVLEEVKPKRSLEATILWLKLRYFAHVMGAKGSLERDIMLGQVAGYREQGMPRMRWLDSMKNAIGLRDNLWLKILNETVQRQEKMAHAGVRKDSE
jgi:hypothetical protein